MKEVEVFQTKEEAISKLDNGGRFYSFFSKSNDGLIDSFEVAKAAGLFVQYQKMILFLELSMLKLSESDKRIVFESFASDTKSTFNKYKPILGSVSQVRDSYNLDKNLITECFPKILGKSSSIDGYITLPIVADKDQGTKRVPLMDDYQIYELFDIRSEDKAIGTHVGKEKNIPGQRLYLGGVVREMTVGKTAGYSTEQFLEVQYYAEI